MTEKSINPRITFYPCFSCPGEECPLTPVLRKAEELTNRKKLDRLLKESGAIDSKETSIVVSESGPECDIPDYVGSRVSYNLTCGEGFGGLNAFVEYNITTEEGINAIKPYESKIDEKTIFKRKRRP